MSKNKVSESNRKQDIVNAALELFIENGYEETSVRMILNKANAVVGSFYHYFNSKEELFEAVIKLYMQKYENRIAIIANDSSKSFKELFYLIMDEVEKGIDDYYFGNLNGGRLHWTIQYAIHGVTIQALLPSIQYMIGNALEVGIAKNVLNLDLETLSIIILKGIEGILHVSPLNELSVEQIKEKKDIAWNFIVFTLDINIECSPN